MSLTGSWQLRLIYSLFACLVSGSVPAAEPQQFPLPPYIDSICIPVTYAGKEHLFMLDSGASAVIIDKSVVGQVDEPLGYHNLIDGEGHRVKVEFFEALPMQVGKTEWTSPQPVGVFDFSGIQAACGRKIEGVLGVPFFKTHIIQLDYDRQAVSILPADTVPEEHWGTAVALKLNEHGVPLVPIQLPGVGAELCAIDTGLTKALSLNWATCLELETNGDFSRRSDTLTAVASGVESIREGVVSKVRLRDFEHDGLAAYCSKGPSAIGLKYLKRFRVTIDLANRVAYFAKGKSFDEPELRTMGFGGVRQGKKTVITALQQGSPGDAAGLKNGDELISAEGKPVRGLPNAEIGWRIRQLSHKGTKPVTLTIRRDGKIRELQLDLSSIYE